jgi:hypothetical protein
MAWERRSGDFAHETDCFDTTYDALVAEKTKAGGIWVCQIKAPVDHN